MKWLLSSFLLLLTSISFSQACGVYTLTFKGELNPIADSIGIPKTRFLHGTEEESFLIFETKVASFSVSVQSHMTSDLFKESSSLKNFYKKKHEMSMPFQVYSPNTINTIYIQWQFVDISKTDNGFEIDLGQINWGNNYENTINQEEVIEEAGGNWILLDYANISESEIKDSAKNDFANGNLYLVRVGGIAPAFSHFEVGDCWVQIREFGCIAPPDENLQA